MPPLISGRDGRTPTMTMAANNYKRRRRSISLLLACVLLTARCCLAFRAPSASRRRHAAVPGLRMRGGADHEPARRPLANSTNFNRLDNTFLRTIRTRSSASSPPLPRGFTYDDEDPEVDGTIVSDNDSYAYTPEVNRWATLVTDGTNAAIMKEDYDPEEGMEILYNNLRELGPDDDVEVEGYWDQLLPTGEYYSMGRQQSAVRTMDLKALFN